jgi:chitodextrinase
MVAAYNFNEGSGTTVTDLSGRGNTGTIANATWTTAGKFGNALQFNGTNARININDSPPLRLTTAMTLEAWVSPSSVTSAWRDVIYKGNDNYYLEATTDRSGFPGAGSTIGSANLTAYGSAVLPLNTWTHLAETYDGTALKLYVNGALASTVAATGLITSSTNQLQIGGDSIFGQYFAGKIDEIRIYNIALTAAQIQADMNTPVAPPGPDTQPPTAPGSLTSTAISASQINLTWTAATDNVSITGYQLERCQGISCNSFALIASPAATDTAYNDTGLTAGTSYSYRLRATDGAGNLGAYSAITTAVTPAPDIEPPGATGTLSAVAVSGVEIDLTWGAATDNVGVIGYRIDRCQGVGCSQFSKLGTTITGTSFQDTGLALNTSYSYLVRAQDAAGNLGPYSNVATATTLATNPQLVTAYSFNEGSGTSVADLSGNGNTGTISNATWTASGKFGSALSFNGTTSQITINDSPTLRLTSGMTIEAWVNPATVSSAWRDIIYKGNDNYYLAGTTTAGGNPATGIIVGSSHVEAYGTTTLPLNT